MEEHLVSGRADRATVSAPPTIGAPPALTTRELERARRLEAARMSELVRAMLRTSTGADPAGPELTH
jgi:hypothetical protein